MNSWSIECRRHEVQLIGKNITNLNIYQFTRYTSIFLHVVRILDFLQNYIIKNVAQIQKGFLSYWHDQKIVRYIIVLHRLEHAYLSIDQLFLRSAKKCKSLQRFCVVSKNGSVDPAAVTSLMAEVWHLKTTMSVRWDGKWCPMSRITTPLPRKRPFHWI